MLLHVAPGIRRFPEVPVSKLETPHGLRDVNVGTLHISILCWCLVNRIRESGLMGLLFNMISSSDGSFSHSLQDGAPL